MAVVIETGFFGAVFPMDHGRVCWSRFATGTVTATGAAAGFAASNAGNIRTDSAWRPDAATGNWSRVFSSAQEVSFVGVANHDLGTQGATVAVEYTNDGGSTWTAFAGLSASPADDGPLLFLMAPRSVDGVRLVISAATAAPTISVIAVGEADEWPRPFMWTGEPLSEGDRIGFDNTISLTGNWLGRTVTSDGLQFDLTMNNAPETWRQTDFAAFKAYANDGEAAFFIAVRPTVDYLNEVSFAWLTDTAKASRELPNRRVSTSVTISCQGLRQYG